MAPGAGASPRLAAHVGGVHYGSHPSTAGRHGAYYGGHHGAGRGWGWSRPIYPYAPYVEPVVVFNLWGFGGGCCCEPSPWIEPAPAFWPVEQPSYVPTYVPAYGPSYGPEYAAPAPVLLPPQGYPDGAAAQAPSAPTWPEPNLDNGSTPSPEAGPPAEGPASDVPPSEPTGPEQQAALTAEDEQALGASLEAFRREAYDEALRLLEALAAKKPDLGHAWLGIAHASFAAGHTQRAAEALTKAALLGGFPRGYRFDPATLYASPEAFRTAREALAAQLTARPNDADAQLVSAWLLVSLGERAAARDRLDTLLALRPGDEAAPILALALLPAVPQPQASPSRDGRPQPVPGAGR